MATAPRCAPLKESDLLIPDGDIKGEQIRQAFRKLFSQLNPFFTSIASFSTSVSLSENEHADLITARFTHGVATAIRLQKLQTARSAIVRSCSGATPIGAPTVQMQAAPYVGAPPVALVTMFFTNPGATNVQAMVELREEGPSLSFAPVNDQCSARYQQGLSQSIPTGIESSINFDTQISDPDGAVTPGSPWLFTVPANKGGLYLCTAGVTLVTPSPAVAINHIRLACRRNGAAVARLSGVQVPAAAGAFTTVSGAVPVFVSAGDLIDFTVYQDSGQSLNTASVSGLSVSTWTTIVRLLGY